MQNLYGCQETNEPEKLYYETQKDNGDGSRGNKEGTARKSEKSPRRKRRRRGARTLGYHAGWWTEDGRSIYNRRRNGNSPTTQSDLQIKRKNWMYEEVSKSKGKIRLTALLEVTVTNFTNNFST